MSYPVYTFGNPKAKKVLIQAVDDHDLSVLESEVRLIREMTQTDFFLMAIKAESWNQDLSPWRAPAVFGNEAFGEGAEPMLKRVLALCDSEEKSYYLGGYSLSGLFALWGASRTDAFAGVCGVSPSVWFPGFVEYMRDNPPICDRIYLSLGDREEKTRNQSMARVGDCIRELYEILQADEIDCTLEWNPGNHFQEMALRMAKGFSWLLNS